jgi:hypothetical protein
MYPLQSAATARMHPPTMSKSRGRCCELEACGTPPSINSENKHFMNRNAGKKHALAAQLFLSKSTACCQSPPHASIAPASSATWTTRRMRRALYPLIIPKTAAEFTLILEFRTLEGPVRFLASLTPTHARSTSGHTPNLWESCHLCDDELKTCF